MGLLGVYVGTNGQRIAVKQEGNGSHAANLVECKVIHGAGVSCDIYQNRILPEARVERKRQRAGFARVDLTGGRPKLAVWCVNIEYQLTVVDRGYHQPK